MKKFKIIIMAVLIVIISLTTYMYFIKQPAEIVPSRATLVLNKYNLKGNEVYRNGGIQI